MAVKEAQANINWLESLTRGVSGEGLRGTRMEEKKGDMENRVDTRNRLWTSIAGLRLFPSGKAGFP